MKCDHLRIQLITQDSPDSPAIGNSGCKGGYVNTAFEYVNELSSSGKYLSTEECYPYKSGVSGTV